MSLVPVIVSEFLEYAEEELGFLIQRDLSLLELFQELNQSLDEDQGEAIYLALANSIQMVIEEHLESVYKLDTGYVNYGLIEGNIHTLQKDQVILECSGSVIYHYKNCIFNFTKNMEISLDILQNEGNLEKFIEEIHSYVDQKIDALLIAEALNYYQKNLHLEVLDSFGIGDQLEKKSVVDLIVHIHNQGKQ